LTKRERDPLTNTTKYYNLIRRLTFPSLKRVLVEVFFTAAIGCGLAFLVATLTFDGFVFGCFFGITVLAIPSVLAEYMLSKYVLKDDPLFYLRRCIALSFVMTLVWVLFLFAGGAFSRIIPGFPEEPFLLGMVCAHSLRSFAILSLSQCSLLRKITASLIQPLSCLAAAFPFLGVASTKAVLLLIPTIAISLLLSYVLLAFIEKRGENVVKTSVLGLFRSFLSVFLDMRNEPLERHLEELSVTESIGVSVLRFKRASDSTTKAVMIVPSFHPGPFLNVGSSVLPMLIQNMVETETKAVAMVPHGVSGHENNVVSQSENHKVVQLVRTLLTAGKQASTASKMIRSSMGAASATCQAFGKCCLVTLTTSPKDMEDIPPEVSSALRKGISDMNELVLIDSHNSIDEMPTMTPQDSYDLVTSGRTALQQAASAKQGPLRVGATKITLREFSLDQGIGPCGLSVIAIETGRQLSVYLTIDGNNMKKGLREQILESAKQAGVNEAEVMTTDSHMVSGRISSRLGYHPVGEAIDNNVLLSRIRSAIGDALIGLEESQAEWNSGNVLVRTLGRRAFENLTTLVQGMSRLAALGFLGIVAVPLLLGLILLH